jgi:hypothetical protein
MKRTVLTWMTSFLLLCGAVQTNWSAEHKVPQFQAGDVFVYDLYWSFLKVGEARLAFSTATIVGSELEALKADFTVRTWGLADTLFKVRDHIQSWIDPSNGRSIHYKKKQHEGRTRRDIEVDFDWTQHTATYRDHGHARDAISIHPDTMDPLALITALARHSFADSPQFSQATTDGKKLVVIDAWLQQQHASLKTKAGRLDAYSVEVSTKTLRGVFEKSPDARIEIWFSHDQPAIPLKLKSKVSVGSFHGELREGCYQGQAIKALNRAPTSSDPLRKSYEGSKVGPK